MKDVIVGTELAIDTELTAELKQEGIAREIVRHIQSARKNAGLNVDDRIRLYVATSEQSQELFEAFRAHKETIMHETLTVETVDELQAHTDTVKIDGAEMTISLQKA